MRDKVSLDRANLLHPAIRQQVIDTITSIENTAFPKTAKIRIAQGLRTVEEQNALFAQGRTKPGAIITNAKGGQSFHNYGLAFDFVLMYDKDNNGTYEALSWDINYDFDKDGKKDWQEVVIPFKLLAFAWGGDWAGKHTDNPHLERTFGFHWSQLLAKHNAKEFIAGTEYVRI